jgi:MFS family permease
VVFHAVIRPVPNAWFQIVSPTSRARYRDVLGAAEFRAIFAANIVSMLGNVVAAVALTVLVYQQTRSPALAASVMALSFLPYLIGGALLGAAADRLSARRVLVACDLASAVLIGCMVIPGMPLPALLALLFATGLLSPVYQGVRSAVLPEVLPPGPRYVLGRALMRMVAQSAQIVGYGVGGLLLAIVSPRPALLADALSFAASGLLLRFGTAARPAPGTRRGSMARDSLTGIGKVFAHRPTRRILLFSWLVPACAVAPEALAAPYATHIGQPARAAGFLLMGIPLGTVAADVLAARLLPSRLQRRIIVPAALLCFALWWHSPPAQASPSPWRCWHSPGSATPGPPGSTASSSTPHHRACGTAPSPWPVPGSCSPKAPDSHCGAWPASTSHPPPPSPWPQPLAHSPPPSCGHSADR